MCASCKGLFTGDRGLSLHLAQIPSCRASVQLRKQNVLKSYSAGSVGKQNQEETATKSQLHSREIEFRSNMQSMVLDGLSSLRLDTLEPDTILQQRLQHPFAFPQASRDHSS
eukprot:4873991-Pleurochrysis_carterae.AAC.1